MTDRQVTWVMFLASVTITGVLFSILVKIDTGLDEMRQAVQIQQKQIDRLNDENHAMHEQLLKMLHTDDKLAHDIDVTQELQRKQAIVVGDLQKGRKK